MEQQPEQRPRVLLASSGLKFYGWSLGFRVYVNPQPSTGSGFMEQQPEKRPGRPLRAEACMPLRGAAGVGVRSVLAQCHKLPFRAKDCLATFDRTNDYLATFSALCGGQLSPRGESRRSRSRPGGRPAQSLTNSILWLGILPAGTILMILTWRFASHILLRVVKPSF